MATELDSRIWLAEDNTKKKFIDVLRIVNNSPICNQKWQNLFIEEEFNTEVENIPEVESFAEVEKVINDYKKTNHSKFTIYTSIKCWRFDKIEIVDSHVMVGISAWDKEYGEIIGFDNRIEGNIQVSVLNVGPYCELLNDDITGFKEVNLKVEENLENYLHLMQSLIVMLNPSLLLTYTNSGEYILPNAHMMYFSDVSYLVESIRYFKTLMSVGELNYNIQALQSTDSKDLKYLFHNWRDAEYQEELRSRLMKLDLSSIKHIDIDTINSILQSGKYDYFESDNAVLVLNYPFFVNSFLDTFIINLIEEAL